MANSVRIRSFKECFWSAGRRWTDAGRTVSIVEDDAIPDEFFRPVFDRLGKAIEGKKELDLPWCDAAYQRWIQEKRRLHDGRNEITRSEYELVKLDYRFLACEMSEEIVEPTSQVDTQRRLQEALKKTK
jgi:hypothetical protein